MPFSKDEKTNELASATVKQIHDIFGSHSGYRAVHAKGILTSGIFEPTEDAKLLSKAAHFQAPVQVAVRFSNSTGLPSLDDKDPNGEPRGMAVRFFLGDDRKHTDIVAHSTPHFPVQNGADFLAFFQAVAAGTVPDFLSSHPAALRFVQAPKPITVSYATASYWGLNAFKFINSEGKETFVRYQILSDAGIQSYGKEEAEAKPQDFLQDELRTRLESSRASFSLVAQVAEPDDQTNDVTVEWPEDRKLVKLGTITLDRVVPDSGDLQRTMIFDPIPRVDGVDVSDDPLLDFRASVYLRSGKERREAGGYHPEKLPKIVLDSAKVVT